jgi:hypothetical protein
VLLDGAGAKGRDRLDAGASRALTDAIRALFGGSRRCSGEFGRLWIRRWAIFRVGVARVVDADYNTRLPRKVFRGGEGAVLPAESGLRGRNLAGIQAIVGAVEAR